MVTAVAVLLTSMIASAAPPGETPPSGPPGETPPTAPPGETPPTATPGETPPTAPPAPTARDAPLPPAATAAPALTQIDPDTVPPVCAQLIQPASAATTGIALMARVSLARCIADQKLAALVLCDCEQSVHEVEDATAASFALLEEAIASGDVAKQVLARHAEGELLATMATRMLASLPPVLADATEEAIALHDLRAQMLRPLVQPWLEHAEQAFASVDRAAQANPDLMKNTAVRSAVADSQQRLAATRGKALAGP